MNFLKNHIRNNKGDSNVSKMTIIAIVFVVGAILLVLTTSAFRGPIHNWFSKVTTGWFADENGMFEADNAFFGCERNENGTYKGVKYICYFTDGTWVELLTPEAAQNGRFGDYVHSYQYYNADGSYNESPMILFENTCSLSEDGATITIGTGSWVTTFTAQPPQ